MADALPSGTQSLDRAMAILVLVASRSGRGIRFTDIAMQTGLAKPTAHRLLRAMQRHGLIEQEAQSELYHLGAEAFVLGTLAADRFGVHRAALPSLTRLSRTSLDTSFLTVRRGWHSICLCREEGAFPIRSHALQVGDRHPLGVGAGSLAILAALNDDEIEHALAANASELASNYPAFTIGFLRDEVSKTRAEGFAFNPGLFVTGSWAIGVAISNGPGKCEGALSIAAIDSRLDKDRRGKLAIDLRVEAQRVIEQLSSPRGAARRS